MLNSATRKRMVSLFLCMSFTGLNVMPAQAAMVSTPELVQSELKQLSRAQLAQWLNRGDVQQRLIKMGVDPAAAQARVADLTDAQVAELNQRLEQLPAGGDILGLVVLLFLVFVFTDIIGATDIFPFVHPVR
ncbi:MAG: PA2779 family protein [Gammaproteobacteria bacterium]|nr:PA2779 family protein [Gammaproteobacteria bacterium]